MSSSGALAARVVRWQAAHGRHDLPWQGTRDPYRVWLSEIMLQQTQVSTVLGYYPRFVQRFPDVSTLARATQEEVMALWSGLGYYSRARHLHRCAQVVVHQHGGAFPQRAEALQTLPGIGRSTAAAIAAFCHGERVAILDGNVKRVLTRALGFSGDLAQPAQERALWQLATDLLPRRALATAMPAYTQGLMDLGSGVCTRHKPRCHECPLAELCVARQQDRVQDYPVKTRKLQRRTETWWLLWAQQRDGSVWLQRRAQRGIWAGLHCLPVFSDEEALRAALTPAQCTVLQPLPEQSHELTHRSLRLRVWHVPMRAGSAPRAEGQWFTQAQWQACGMPAPVTRLLGGARGTF